MTAYDQPSVTLFGISHYNISLLEGIKSSLDILPTNFIVP